MDNTLVNLCVSYWQDGDEFLVLIKDRLEETLDPRLPEFAAHIETIPSPPDWTNPEFVAWSGKIPHLLPEYNEGVRLVHEADEKRYFLQETTPKVGNFVLPDSWKWSSSLVASDWDQADFRLPSASYSNVSYAVKIAVTGRKVHYNSTFGRRVRVQITFVGDGEPDSIRYGWMSIMS